MIRSCFQIRQNTARFDLIACRSKGHQTSTEGRIPDEITNAGRISILANICEPEQVFIKQIKYRGGPDEVTCRSVNCQRNVDCWKVAAIKLHLVFYFNVSQMSFLPIIVNIFFKLSVLSVIASHVYYTQFCMAMITSHLCNLHCLFWQLFFHDEIYCFSLVAFFQFLSTVLCALKYFIRRTMPIKAKNERSVILLLVHVQKQLPVLQMAMHF